MLVRFFVPKLGNAGEDGYKVAEEVEAWLAELYGGATSHDGTGAWVDDGGNLIQEPVTIVESYVNAYNGMDLTRIARHVRSALSQETVAYAIDRSAEMTVYDGLPSAA